MQISTLVTHSGGFHADETFATAVLSDLHPAAQVLRTRDAALIAQLAPAAIIYDVGSAYDPERRIFDHHQIGSPRRDAATPFSAFGLIWRAYGRDWLQQAGIEASLIEGTHAAIDDRVVRPIDLLDNGVLSPNSLGVAAELSIPAIIEAMNPAFDAGSPIAEEVAFGAAVAFARTSLRAQAISCAAALRAEALILEALEAQAGAQIIELAGGMPLQVLSKHPKAAAVLFVVRPRRADWAVTGVAREPGSFALRRDLPADWAGLEGPALEAVTGVPGSIFCHKGRFMAAATDRTAALTLARQALGWQDLH